MKNLVKSLVLLIAVSFAAQLTAQTSGALWVGTSSNNVNANAVHAAFSKAYDAFFNGDAETAWAVYTDDAAELDPTGNITFGKKALREAWDGFLAMADEAPVFKYENVLVRMLTDDVALAIWDTEADIKIGGQQVGGKAKGMAVLRKIKGQWKMEFDSLTPIVSMGQ